MRKRVIASILGGLVVVALVLASCGPGQTSPTSKTSSSEPKYGGTFRYGYASQPLHLDPHMSTDHVSAHVWRLAGSGIMKYRLSDYMLQPDIAESWETKDPTTLVFHLRKGVKFLNKPPVNGRECTSEDVKYTIERMATPKPDFPWNANFGTVTSIETPDKYTVVIKIKEPRASFFTTLADRYVTIIPKEVIDKYGDAKKPEAVLGTGPFILEKFDVASGGTFVKNPDYFLKDRPYLEKVEFSIIPDWQTRKAAFIAGKIDNAFDNDFTARDADDIRKAVPDANILVQKDKAWGGGYFLSLNVQRKPWNDVRVRRAVFLAIDRQQMIQMISQGSGTIAGPMGTVNPWALPIDELSKMPGYRQPKDQDIAEAKRLLAEAGYPNGFEAVCNVNLQYQNKPPAEVIQAQLEKIGIKVKLNVMEWAAQKKAEKERNYDIQTEAYGYVQDPDGVLYTFFHSKGSRNYTGFSDPKFDELVERQMKAMNYNERVKLVHEASRYLIEQAPAAFTYNFWNYWALSSRIHNFEVGGSGYTSPMWTMMDAWSDN